MGVNKAHQFIQVEVLTGFKDRIKKDYARFDKRVLEEFEASTMNIFLLMS